MKKYKHVFFDLDNTLWDFERNSKEMLHELYQKYELNNLGVPSPEVFISKYQERNAMMWEQYRLGKIDKDTLRNKRFEFTFWDMGLEAETIPSQLADDYVMNAPKKNHLFPDAKNVLDYLQKKEYELHIITNGFAEVQFIKMEAAGISEFFGEIIISEHTGYKKPDANIFHYALNKANATADDSVMIGDGLVVDVIGAINAGWDAIYFNPLQIPHEQKVTHEISSLIELKKLL